MDFANKYQKKREYEFLSGGGGNMNFSGLTNSLYEISLEKQNSMMELELVKTRQYNNDTIHKLHDLEVRHEQLQVKMQSLLEKLSSLEDENRVLRQKAVSPSPKINHPELANSFDENYTVVPVHPNNYQKREYESPTPSKLIEPSSHSLSDSIRTKMTAERHQENEFVVQENHEFLRRCM